MGWLASLVMRTDAQMGVVANVVVRILGSLLGRWLAAIVGAVLPIAILQAFGAFRPRAGALTATAAPASGLRSQLGVADDVGEGNA